VIAQTDSLANAGIDSLMKLTNDMLSKNMDDLKNSGKAFEKEMQDRF